MVDEKATDAAAYPWPFTRSAHANAKGTPILTPATITAEELAAEIGIYLDARPDDISRARRLLEVAREKVEEYAPRAPIALKNEAIIRFAGYLTGSDYGGVASESVGPRSVAYTPPSTNAAMFRNSGAAGLLTRWKRRRAGGI